MSAKQGIENPCVEGSISPRLQFICVVSVLKTKACANCVGLFLFRALREKHHYQNLAGLWPEMPNLIVCDPI